MPLPVAPALIVIHAALLVAVQAQPVAAVTVTVPPCRRPTATLADVGGNRRRTRRAGLGDGEGVAADRQRAGARRGAGFAATL